MNIQVRFEVISLSAHVNGGGGARRELLLLLLETGSHVTQADLKLMM